MLGPLKYLNTTGLVDYHWVFNLDLLKMADGRYQ